MKFGTFIEIKGGTALDDLNFLVKARSDDETRQFMLFMYVEKENDSFLGVCTDGRRIHVLRELHPILIDNGIDEGFWHVVKAQAKCVQLAKVLEPEGMIFPNWRKIAPSDNPVMSLEFGGVDFKKIKRGEYSTRLIKFLRSFPEITSVNMSFLNDLGIGYLWNVQWYAPNRVISFFAGHREAYIMPMQVDAYE